MIRRKLIELKKLRHEKISIGSDGRGANGLPSSSTEGLACILKLSSTLLVSLTGEAVRGSEVEVGDRRWRIIGGGAASSLLDASSSASGDVGDRGG